MPSVTERDFVSGARDDEPSQRRDCSLQELPQYSKINIDYVLTSFEVSNGGRGGEGKRHRERRRGCSKEYNKFLLPAE